MQQVSIRMIQVSWIKDFDLTKQFFVGVINSNNLDFFKNRNMTELIKYMWDISEVYFIWYRFLPFVILLYLPITVFCFIPIDANTGTDPDLDPDTEHEIEYKYLAQLTCLSLTCLYMMKQVYGQLYDMCNLGLGGYFTSFNSMYELLILAFIGLFVYYAAHEVVEVEVLEKKDNDGFIETLRCLEIAIVLLLNLQLFRFLKIFKFFQSFIRQFLEIAKGTAQIASMLFFVILTQAVLLYILDENSTVPVYH